VAILCDFACFLSCVASISAFALLCRCSSIIYSTSCVHHMSHRVYDVCSIVSDLSYLGVKEF
jgi:hypothetical protein